MPFVALDVRTGLRIDVTAVAGPLDALRADAHVCPVCGQRMILRAGLVKRPHFAHMPGKDCPYAEYAARETAEHREAKVIVRDMIAQWFAEYSAATAELEVYIPDVQHARNRIADILFTFRSGWRVAHEIQLAQISTAELWERTQDYWSAGIDVFWWFGRDADTAANRDWSLNNYGFYLDIRIAAPVSSNRDLLHASNVTIA